MMFSLNMLDYPMSFLSLSTWTWNTFPRPAHEILVSAQGPLVLVLRLRFGAKGLGPGQGLTISSKVKIHLRQETCDHLGAQEPSA